MPSFWKKDDPNKGRVLLAGFGNNTRWVDKDALRLVGEHGVIERAAAARTAADCFDLVIHSILRRDVGVPVP